MKMSPNAPCPCGSGKKYKKCCRNIDDYPSKQQHKHILSLKDKNVSFVECIAASLQFDKIPLELDLGKFKRAFTPKAVRNIYESIIKLWPTLDDCKKTLLQQRKDVTALYSGTYEPDEINRAITRHALYRSEEHTSELQSR